MLTIPNHLVKIGEAIWVRVTIGLFFYLSLIFFRKFVPLGAQDHPYLTVLCAIFYEATAIIIFNLLYAKYSVGRDINALSTIGLFFELIYLPFFFAGIDVSTQLNLAAKGLNGLIILRCVFMTERDLLGKFAPIEFIKQWLLKREWFASTYLNGLTVAVFVFCAIPLFTMMYLINTDEMRASGIAVVLFAFYVAFENAKRHAATLGGDAEPASAAVEVGGAEAEDDALFLPRAIYVGVALCIALAANAIADNKERFFNVGYASGYADAKSGAAPKREADFKKALWCNMVKERGQADPPGLNCNDGPK